jgi:hypothetical protein
MKLRFKLTATIVESSEKTARRMGTAPEDPGGSPSPAGKRALPFSGPYYCQRSHKTKRGPGRPRKIKPEPPAAKPVYIVL